MKHAAWIVGNSSSGIIEAPIFKVPVVNIGTRQRNRVRARNVIDSPYKKEPIIQALKIALSDSFRQGLKKGCDSPYGDGKASQRIIKILLNTQITDKLLIKDLTY
jgi:UDP-N-acetylglucosamine 2-epimerase